MQATVISGMSPVSMVMMECLDTTGCKSCNQAHCFECYYCPLSDVCTHVNTQTPSVHLYWATAEFLGRAILLEWCFQVYFFSTELFDIFIELKKYVSSFYCKYKQYMRNSCKQSTCLSPPFAVKSQLTYGNPVELGLVRLVLD